LSEVCELNMTMLSLTCSVIQLSTFYDIKKTSDHMRHGYNSVANNGWIVHVKTIQMKDMSLWNLSSFLSLRCASFSRNEIFISRSLQTVSINWLLGEMGYTNFFLYQMGSISCILWRYKHYPANEKPVALVLVYVKILIITGQWVYNGQATTISYHM
jgi:hypothetical protein